MSEDRGLIVRAVEGDREALDALAARHRPTVLRTARHLLGDAELAEDVTQDVFIRLQASLPGFRGDAELGTWLYRVTLNLCRDQFRRRRHRTVDVDDEGATTRPQLRVVEHPDDAVDVERARSAVRAAIDRLPEDQKEAVMLRFLSDLSYREIARITAVPLGTVASRVFRALKRLGEDIESRHPEVVR